MAAEDVDALIVYGGRECAEATGLAPDAYFSNDLPGSVVIFCGDADPVVRLAARTPSARRARSLDRQKISLAQG